MKKRQTTKCSMSMMSEFTCTARRSASGYALLGPPRLLFRSFDMQDEYEYEHEHKQLHRCDLCIRHGPMTHPYSVPPPARPALPPLPVIGTLAPPVATAGPSPAITTPSSTRPDSPMRRTSTPAPSRSTSTLIVALTSLAEPLGRQGCGPAPPSTTCAAVVVAVAVAPTRSPLALTLTVPGSSAADRRHCSARPSSTTRAARLGHVDRNADQVARDEPVLVERLLLNHASTARGNGRDVVQLAVHGHVAVAISAPVAVPRSIAVRGRECCGLDGSHKVAPRERHELLAAVQPARARVDVHVLERVAGCGGAVGGREDGVELLHEGRWC